MISRMLLLYSMAGRAFGRSSDLINANGDTRLVASTHSAREVSHRGLRRWLGSRSGFESLRSLYLRLGFKDPADMACIVGLQRDRAFCLQESESSTRHG